MSMKDQFSIFNPSVYRSLLGEKVRQDKNERPIYSGVSKNRRVAKANKKKHNRRR